MPSLSIRPSRLIAALPILLIAVCSNSAKAAPFMPNPSWTRQGAVEGANAGFRSTIVGDVNGDGFRDILMTRLRPGDVSLHLGSAQGLSATAAWVFVPSEHGGNGTNIVVDYLDLYVGSAGDLNADGHDDVIIGNPYNSVVNNSTGEGKAWIFLGTPSGLASSAVWTINGSQELERLGFWVGSAGDVNGDGYDEAIVGVPDFGTDPETSFPGPGKMMVFHGSPTGPTTTPSFEAVADQPSAGFGERVGTLGDVNADGYADVFVGAPGYDHPEISEGVVFVYTGSATGLSATPILVEANVAGANFGSDVAAAGDVNGDGFDDVVVGAQFDDTVTDSGGAAYVFTGESTGVSPVPLWTVRGGVPGVRLGHTVGGVGDPNGDGFDEIAIATPYSLPTGTNTRRKGIVHIYRGSTAGPVATPTWSKSGYVKDGQFGHTLGGGGDVNGDGLDDMLVAAPWLDGFYPAVGTVYLFNGCLESDGDGVCNTLDNCQNLANTTQINADADPFGDACDCAPASAGFWQAPTAVEELTVLPGAGPGSMALSWEAPQSAGGGGALVYDTLRSVSADNFVGAATCIETDDGADRAAVDADSPAAGGIWFYLVRAENGCPAATSSLGVGTAGVPRQGRSCP